jgi:hypothetical protein
MLSAYVEGFGCRRMTTTRLAPWPASESLQRTKPREVAGDGAAGAMGICARQSCVTTSNADECNG